jgi:ELWxxDGT repeat protein
MDINTTTGSSNPWGFTALNGYLYFAADDGVTGGELWRTDGSTTTQVDDINTTGSDGSYPYVFIPLGDYLYFTADNGTASYVYRTNGTGTELVPFPDAGQRISCDCFDSHIVAVGGRLFSTVESDAIGHEFAYLDEPTYVLPETNRDGGVGSAWTIALSALALVTLAAGVAMRRRSGAAQR